MSGTGQSSFQAGKGLACAGIVPPACLPPVLVPPEPHGLAQQHIPSSESVSPPSLLTYSSLQTRLVRVIPPLAPVSQLLEVLDQRVYGKLYYHTVVCP